MKLSFFKIIIQPNLFERTCNRLCNLKFSFFGYLIKPNLFERPCHRVCNLKFCFFGNLIRPNMLNAHSTDYKMLTDCLVFFFNLNDSSLLFCFITILIDVLYTIVSEHLHYFLSLTEFEGWRWDT